MKTLNRRQFIKLNAIGSLGLVLGWPASASSDGKESTLIHPLIRVGSDGIITLYAQNPEMGQGVKTALPMIIAEELDVDWQSIRIEQSDWNTDLDNQFSGGSLSVRLNYSAMRQAGASARDMLTMAAAENWQVPFDELHTEMAQVVHAKSGRAAAYGELASKAATLPVPEQPRLKADEDFKLIGQSTHDVDLNRIVAGRQQYSLDLTLPKMLYGVIRRSPVSDGQVASFDDSATREIPGIIDCFALNNNQHGGRVIQPNSPNFVSGVAVMAESTWAAIKGARALKVEWQQTDSLSDSNQLMSRYAAAINEPGETVRNDGDIEQALTQAEHSLDSYYRLPLLAHVPMEPMNCTADVRGDRAVIWAPTQNPEMIIEALVLALKIKAENITVKVMRSGGAFGRRYYADFTIDTALLSQRLKRPVKVVWTREDDIQHDYFRPSSLHRVKAGVDADGKISAWHHKLANHSRGPYLERDGSPAEIANYEFPAAFVPNLKYEYVHVPDRIPLGQWRAVEHSSNVFVVASVIDELAHKARIDPLKFLKRLIGESRYVQVREDFRFDASRLLQVVDRAARLADWDSPLPDGHGRGIAASYNQGAWIAEVAEVSISGKSLKINRIVAVTDCGRLINPTGARAQVEGGIIEGLSATLMGQITVSEGVVQQNNFHNYRICSIAQMPAIEVHFIDSGDSPRGLGEPPLPPLAPAVCNAIFAANGHRVRDLPLSQHYSV
jgi:isoquinoline 1-oxidoreductase beta subunit